jgi:hypothetical protein
MILADMGPSGGDCSIVSVLLFASLVVLTVVLARRARLMRRDNGSTGGGA